MMTNPRSKNKTRRILLLAVSFLLVAGASAAWLFHSRKPPAPQAPAPKSTNAKVDPEELDRLRSLGYLDFVPEKKGDSRSGLLRRTDAAYPGYNFFTNAYMCMAVLTDDQGEVVNYWLQQGLCDRWANAEFLENGDILVIGRDQRQKNDQQLDSRRFLMKLSWTGEVLWKRPVAAHHDVEVAPSRKLLALTTGLRTIQEVHPTLPIRDNRITVLSENGEEEESASLYDIFRTAPGLVAIQPVRPKSAREIDLIHANSVEWIRPEKLREKRSGPLYSPANILFCTRHQDVIGIVDWRTKKLIWAWGQGILSGPHDATLLPNGNILLFDNGLARGWSRILELDPVEKQIVWQYPPGNKSDFFTADRGSSQRLPNGNTLIAESDKGRAFEVTPDGQIAWEYLNPFRNAKGERATIVRFYRIDSDVVRNILRSRGEGRKKPPLQVKTSAASRETY